MKNPFKALMLAALLVATSFTACKKDEENSAQLNDQFKQFNDDSQYYKSQMDQADNDINGALSEIPAFGRFSSTILSTLSSPLCGCTIDSSQLAQKIVFFNFDGVTPCFSPSCTRSGQIKVQLTTGTFWSDVNSILTVTYINYKITRLYDNKSITFNGVKTVKNLNGNNWIGFLLGSATLRYQERAFNINVLFDNGATSVWNVARITEWTYTPTGPLSPKINFYVTGDSLLNGFNNTDSWGINRFGQPFTTYYTTPIVSNTYCGLWRPNFGSLTHHLAIGDFSLDLGLDQSGNPTPYDCAYGYKVTWTSNGNTYVSILSY